MLNKDLSPKPAYQVLDQLFNHQWKTHAKLITNAEGRIMLRGFYGEYQVRPRTGNAQTFPHSPGTASEWTIRLDQAATHP